MPVINPGPYPTYAQVMNLARSYVNDTFRGATGTPGEGQILTDSAPFTLPFLRAMTAELYQELGNISAGALIRDNFILFNVPPVHGFWGIAATDPATETYFGYNGFFDGRVLHPNLALPADFYAPLYCWERTSNTNNEFQDMMEVQHALPAAKQTTANAFWEWRQDRIVMPGSLLMKDIKIRYVAVLPLLTGVTDLTTVQVPLIDCENALALKIARSYGLPRGSDQIPIADAMEKAATHLLKNRIIRSQQAIDFRAEPYGQNRLNLFPLDLYR